MTCSSVCSDVDVLWLGAMVAAGACGWLVEWATDKDPQPGLLRLVGRDVRSAWRAWRAWRARRLEELRGQPRVWNGWKVAALSALSVAWATALARGLWAPEPGWYDFHMSFHEHWYSSVLRGDVVDRWLPPGYTWAARLLPVPPVVAFRLVSVAACAALVWAAWRRSPRAAVLVASLPFLVVFGTRAQPDALMLALVIVGLERTRRGFLGGLMVGLSAFVKPVAVALAGTVRPTWRWVAGLLVGAAPFVAWLWMHAGAVALHAGKSAPFEDGLRLALVLPLVAWPLLPLAGRGAAYWLGVLGFVGFAFLKAPIGHEYYLLPALVLFAVGATTGRRAFWPVVFLNAVVACVLVPVLGAVTW